MWYTNKIRFAIKNIRFLKNILVNNNSIIKYYYLIRINKNLNRYISHITFNTKRNDTI